MTPSHSTHLFNREEKQKLEQKTLLISFLAVLVSVFVGIFYGIYIGSDAVILDGVFSSFSLIGTGLNWTISRVVWRSPDKRFQYGYTHLEPLANMVNALMMLVLCLYALVNGLQSLTRYVQPVSAESGILYAFFSSIFCCIIWLYERRQLKKIGSELIRTDAAEWLLDLMFSVVILLGFAIAYFLKDEYGFLLYYIDPVLVCLLSVGLLPLPFSILKKNLRQVLMITGEEQRLTPKIQAVIQELVDKGEVTDYTTHVIKNGRFYFIEVSILVNKNFSLQTVEQQDVFRQRIVAALKIPLDILWLSVYFTAQKQLHD